MEQKRQEIIEAKRKKANELQKRVENITRAREVSVLDRFHLQYCLNCLLPLHNNRKRQRCVGVQERRKASRTLRQREKAAKQEAERRTAELRESSAKTLLAQIEARHATIHQEREALRLE